MRGVERSMAGATKKESKNSFSPIEDEKDDVLDRGGFVKQVSRALINYGGKDKSLTMAICGEWGEGKSSIKNLIKKECRSESSTSGGESDKLIMIEVRPERIHDNKNLELYFFREIVFLLKKEFEKCALAKKLENYIGYLKLSTGSFDPYYYGLTLGLIFLGALSIFMPMISKAACVFDPGIIVIAAIIVIILVSVFFLCLIMKEELPYFKSVAINYSLTTGRKMDEARDEFNQLLREREKPLVVVIDEIDRLKKDQITALFKVLNANFDFPNLIYLLFFQRAAVERAFDSEDSESETGGKYMEKMVQVFIDVPNVPKRKINDFFINEIKDFLERKKIIDKLEEVRLNKIFYSTREINHDGAEIYFHTLRGVRRFTFTFEFYINSFLGETDTVDINIVDLIGIEIIRHFEPRAYSKIKQRRKLLTGGVYVFPLEEGERKKKIRKEIDEIFDLVPVSRRDTFQAVMFEIFPYVKDYHHNINQSDAKDNNYRQGLRICHDEIFERYFSISLLDTDVPQHSIERFFSASNDRSDLLSYLLELKKTDELGKFLSAFYSYTRKINAERIINIMIVIFDIGDDFPCKKEDDSISEINNALELMTNLLNHVPDNKDKMNIISMALSETRGVFLPMLWIFYESKKLKRDRINRGHELSVEELEVLKAIGGNIINRFKNNNPYESKHLAAILYSWCQTYEEGAAQEWVKEMNESDRNLVKFLVAFFGDIWSTHAWFSTSKLSCDEVFSFFPTENIKDRLENIRDTDLTEKEHEVVNFVLDSLE